MELTDENAVVTASLSFFFEASADSDSLLEDHDSASLGDDDAESCNWDSGDHCSYCDEDDDDIEDDDGEHCLESDVGFGFNCDELEEADRDCVDDDGRAMARSRVGGQKSSASVESTGKELEALSEVEKNRLFWEACLAS